MLLDEPSLGLSPKLTRQIFAIIRGYGYATMELFEKAADKAGPNLQPE